LQQGIKTFLFGAHGEMENDFHMASPIGRADRKIMFSIWGFIKSCRLRKEFPFGALSRHIDRGKSFHVEPSSRWVEKKRVNTTQRVLTLYIDIINMFVFKKRGKKGEIFKRQKKEKRDLENLTAPLKGHKEIFENTEFLSIEDEFFEC